MEIVESTSIETIEIIEETMLKFLLDLKIRTVGELLGATAGLQRIPAVENAHQWEEIFNLLKQVIPAELLEIYRQPMLMPKMGLWINEDDSDA